MSYCDWTFMFSSVFPPPLLSVSSMQMLCDHHTPSSVIPCLLGGTACFWSAHHSKVFLHHVVLSQYFVTVTRKADNTLIKSCLVHCFPSALSRTVDCFQSPSPWILLPSITPYKFLTSVGLLNQTYTSEDSKLTLRNERQNVRFVFLCPGYFTKDGCCQLCPFPWKFNNFIFLNSWIKRKKQVKLQWSMEEWDKWGKMGQDN